MTDRSSDAVEPTSVDAGAAPSEDGEETPTMPVLPEDQVRHSHATPNLEAQPEAEEEGEDFFDGLGDRLSVATDRFRRAFRRPDPDEVQVPHVDGYRAAEDDGYDDVDDHIDDGPEDGSEDDDLERFDQDAGPDADYVRDRGQHPSTDHRGFWADDVVEEATRADTDPTYRESIVPGLNDPEATQAIPVISATTTRNSRISLPRPPSAEEHQAEESRAADDGTSDRSGRTASEERRRAVILEKAAAIEAVAEQERREAQDRADSGVDDDGAYTYVPPYNLPSRDPEPRPRTTDLVRQAVVSLGFVGAVTSVLMMWDAGMFVGGAFDTIVDGWYSGQQALLTPSHWFYWFWPVVVVTLIGHTVHQWSTSQISTPRQRRTGWLVALSSLMMLVWVLAVRADNLTVAALSALAAALALIDSIRQFTLRTARNSGERRLTDGPVGLFTGFAMVHAMGSLSAWLTAHNIHIPVVSDTLWALAGLAVCIWLGSLYSMTERGRITIALGLGWGMFWLVFPRLLSDLQSVTVAIVAAMGAFIIILATQSRRHRINYAERRAAMGRPVDDII
ncbi:hypothetical protein [Nesterenkonia marinintestina]|uniref:hypothetical protein n=1 Tax=Nesterenkonia marinintestina TaxID=2979865 RepID=UPI0021BEA8BE|nr:hypothetical protein [Nesterenkonia sp. GX14115]